MAWEVKKLGEVIAENPKSKIQVRNALNKGKYVFFTSGEKTRFFDSHFCDGENIFIATGGKAAIKFYDGAAAYSTDTYSIKGKNSISLTKYIYYFILINMKKIEEKMFLGTAIKHLQKKDFKNLELLLPPIPEQKRIVSILDKSFESITKAKENAVNNLKNAKEIFENYLQKVFETKGEDWEKKMLVEITSLLGDGLHGTPKYTDKGEYYFINGNNFNNGKIIFKDSTKRVSVLEYEKYKKRLNDRTILVSINGTLGNVAFYNNEKIILGKSACYFNLKEGMDKNFIKYIISSPYFLKYAHKEATGATIKNVSLKTMREFKVPLPALKEQQLIVSKLDALSAETKKLETIYEQKLADLEELKKSILQKAFNGELTNN
jgi:type I restriction enzyme S subunit